MSEQYIILIQVTTGPVTLRFNDRERRNLAIEEIYTCMAAGKIIRVARPDDTVREIIAPDFITQVKSFNNVDAYSKYMRVVYRAQIFEQADDTEEDPDTPWYERNDDWWRGNG